MQQSLGQDQLGQSTQMLQQSQLAQAQQQMVQQQLAQSHMVQQAQQQMAQHIVQSQMLQQQQQQQMSQPQTIQQQLAQQQIAQTQLSQQQMTQPQIVQQQMTQPQIVQQQITQPQMVQQQITQQQLQQMMYCPTVRLVYDAPMLMQSGEQIQQQSQNIFVNQPPWARPVQNQVIYVQQIGSNLVPVQHLDPNMFLQQATNIPMYQQVVQNVPQLVQNLPQTVQSLPQGQIRQIMNSIPAGMVQNFGTNVQRIPEQNLGQVVQHFGFVQAQAQANNDSNVTNVNVVNNEVDRQVSNQVNAQQNIQNQEVQQVYRQIVPQVIQQQIRTQVPPSSQQQNVQNIQTTGQPVNTNKGLGVGGNLRTNTTNVTHNMPQNVDLKINNIIRASINQNITPNPTLSSTNIPQIRHIIQTQNVNIVPQSIPQNMPNTSMIQSYATSAASLNTVTYSAVRNGQPYTYRAIQPKPNTTTNIRVNFKPRGTQVPMVRRPPPPNVQNQPTNQNIPVSTNTVPTSASYMPIKMETDSPTFNRKRKSESPDEIQKKVSNYGSITVTAQVKDKIKAKYANTNEIGVNTSPVHKPHNINKVENQLPVLQINPMEAKIKQEFLSPTGSVPNIAPQQFINNANLPVKTEKCVEHKEKKDSKDVSQQTEEKLVRKTVFPQAKATGRLLDIKTNTNMPKIDDPKNINIIQNESLSMPILTVESNYLLSEKAKPVDTKSANVAPITNLNTTVTNEMIPGPIVENKLAVPIKDEKQQILVANAESNTLNNSGNIIKEKESKAEPKEEKTTDVTENTQKVDEKVENNTKCETNLQNMSIGANLSLPSANTDTKPDITKVEPAEVKLTTDFEQVIKDSKIEKKEYKNISISEMTGKEIHIVDGNIHKEEKERDFVLTHVLDGFVIQESNVPFAIRRPLKEKTVNAFVEDKQDPNLSCIKAAKDEIRGHILELSQLHINENKDKETAESETELKKNEKEDLSAKENEQIVVETKEEKIVENEDQQENPFQNVKQSDVKLWTVNDLSAHLSKYNWTETVSTLLEHEIDGESLFLVTKTQLVTIGINEAHADVICEFVGSKN